MNVTKGRQTATELGRRVARRRGELSFSVDEVAGRAGISAEYLRHLEQNAAIVSAETLMRLARALEISGWALLGDDSAWPRGAPRGAVPPAEATAGLTELGEAECWRLISPGGVGRVITGVSAVPVNYALF